MPQLSVLDFHCDDEESVRSWHQESNALTIPLMEALLEAPYLARLAELDLSNTKISYKHLLRLGFRNRKISTKLTQLKLSNSL